MIEAPQHGNSPAPRATGEKGGGMSRRGITWWLVGVVAVAALAAPSAFALKPTFERIDIDETFEDGFLTEACGVPVTTHAEGHVTLRVFEGAGTGVAELNTLNVALTAMSGDNTYRFRDVGADLVRIEPDGTPILLIVGQIPFGFAGVLKIDLETNEVILEPQHSLEGNVEEACAALTA
jgi:hypothetical protein